MKRSIIPLLLMLIALLIIPFDSAVGTAHEVDISLPSFAVTLNGIIVDSAYREYPFIVYNNITYFPMTYFDCRFLGLETDWSSETGLAIRKTDISGPYENYVTNRRNSSMDKAAISGIYVSVNGIVIDNSREEYPLLVYRGVTYFPMTWRFCYDEFGWDYTFSHETGFAISIPIESLSIDRIEPIVKGESYQLAPVLVPGNASTIGISYSSSNEAVATVSSSGMITAVNAGTTQITAMAPNGTTATVTISVIVPVTQVRIEMEQSRYRFSTDETIRFNVIVLPDDATDKNVDIQVSNAELIGTGSIMPSSSGTASITATATNGLFGKIEIEIIDLNELAEEVVRLTNAERVSAGRSALNGSLALLNSASMTRAKEIIESFSHDRPDGRSCFTAFSDIGLSYGWAGENISMGRDNPESTVAGWMNSEGHRQNILNSNFKSIGVGVAMDDNGRMYWVQMFIG